MAGSREMRSPGSWAGKGVLARAGVSLARGGLGELGVGDSLGAKEVGVKLAEGWLTGLS